MATIQNPILPGFNPDPSILRVGEDYYIATSTFEWFPGVQIHHSRDLANWRLAAHPLDRKSQLDMAGEDSSCGIWAPCLSYADGLFWLIYTDVKHFSAKTCFKDVHNYLSTAPSVEGPWSEPVYLNSSGFDASLFHDDDGKKWLVNMIWDFRAGHNAFSGVALQEYSVREKKLVGGIRNIFKGTKLGITEGPHLYKKDGWYYLIVAEGGTFLEHAESMARSRALDGPYEEHPDNPIITSRPYPDAPLRRAGHASLVETQGGEWYLAHLCSRPVNELGESMLGRETGIQKVEWRADGWLYLSKGEKERPKAPALLVEGPKLPPHPWPAKPPRDDFDADELGIDFQSLRIPLDDSLASLQARKGWLRLYGAESTASKYRQALVARRQQHFNFRARCLLEFKPEDYQQAAGLIFYYDTMVHYYLNVRMNDELGPSLAILVADKARFSEPTMGKEVALGSSGRVWLEAEVKTTELRFSYSLDGKEWKRIGPVLEANKCSDEYFFSFQEMRFTGAFVGLCCQDISGRRRSADFDWFEYEPLP